MGRDDRRSRLVLGLLLLASFTVITLDAGHRGGSPVDPLRQAAGAVFGPMEAASAALSRPVADLREHFTSVGALTAENQRLRRANTALQRQLHTSVLDQRRAGELNRLLAVSTRERLRLVPAQVVAMGSAQTFAETVTIDAGTRDGVRSDMTVLTGAGLVGRVLSAGVSTATVLLITDPESVVGGRLSSSMELGFLRGAGGATSGDQLQLTLVDQHATPARGDVVVSWGSQRGAPYIGGVPIGQVVSVRSSPRQLTTTALVRPYVNFSALDVVGVVVGTHERAPRQMLTGQALRGPAGQG
jgi:rod shape-determining protein MreC